MKKIWVTGSKGQLGTELFNQRERLKNFEFAFTDLKELDLTDKKKILKFTEKKKPDVIINCAAYNAVDKAEQEVVNAFNINRDVPAYLVEAASDNGSILIHISTDYVFDGTATKPYTEEDSPNPVSVYAKSKYAGEIAAQKYNKCMTIRTSWLYSVHGTNFVKTILRLAREKDSFDMVDDQQGNPTSATDLAGAIISVIEKIYQTGKGTNGIFHYSNEGICSRYEFATEIINLSGLKCKVNPIKTNQYPLPASRPMYSALDKRKIKEVFGLEIPEWQESLKKVVGHLIEHPEK